MTVMRVHHFTNKTETDGELGGVAGAAFEPSAQTLRCAEDVVRRGGEEGDGFESFFASGWIKRIQLF